MRNSFFLFPALLVCAAPALANVTVYSPGLNARVVSPFWLSASASPCSSQAIAAMGYSFDDSTNTTIVNGAYISGVIGFATGGHVLHIKSWGNHGASCVSDVPLTVVPPPTSMVPSWAGKATQVQTLGAWAAEFDVATGRGSSAGSTNVVGSPSITGYARQFSSTFTNDAGERYSASFGSDSSAQNFLYDSWVYLESSSSGIANIEMDVNQVMPNGQTVIFGFQCDGYSGTWDYTVNTGSPQSPNDKWWHSYSECNPREWSTNTWHHIQISYSRNAAGAVTYKSVWLDNVEQDLYLTVPSAFALGWDPTLLTNFQVDGMGSSGSSKVILDNLTIYWW